MVKHKKPAGWLRVILTLVASVFAASVSMAQPVIERDQRTVPHSMAQVQLSFAPVVEQAAPAVVNIYTKRINRGRSFSGDPFFDRFFGRMTPREQSSLGSGVIVSPDGVIVTNNHVIEEMTEIKVVFADRREFPATLLFTDPQTDLAVLKIEVGEALPFLEFANSDAIEVGDVVLAIGNPFGVGQTVTSGIVSALARTAVSISDYQFFIQTDAAINPGNSGGALVDVNGHLVGVNTAIYSRSGGSNGIGFAIPSRLVQQVISTAIDGGDLERPWIGATTDSVDGDVAKALKLDRPAGALIADIWKSGPADRAGLRPGDVITKIDGLDVFDAETLRYRVGTGKQGDKVSIAFIRDGQVKQARLTLQNPPLNPAPDERQLDGDHPLNGVTVANLSPRYNEQLGLNQLLTGVVVADLDRSSYAARRGLRRGYRIISINGRAVSSAAEVAREITKPSNDWLIEVDNGKKIVPWRIGR